jgi:hypothetical protein
MSSADSVLSHPQLTERFAVLLEIRYREVVDFMLLQEIVDPHARCETKEPTKLGGREGPGPVCFEGQAFQGSPRQVLPSGPSPRAMSSGSSNVICMASPF